MKDEKKHEKGGRKNEKKSNERGDRSKCIDRNHEWDCSYVQCGSIG